MPLANQSIHIIAKMDKPLQEPLVTFVILNWNQPDLTAECLESLSQQTYCNFRVLIVDNGSQDNSVSILRSRFPWAEIVCLEHNVGYGMGNNIGIEYALRTPTDYIFLLNNDTQVAPDMLSILVGVAEADSRIGIVGPTMFYFEPSDVLWSGENHIQWRSGQVLRNGMGKRVAQEALRKMSDCKVDHIDTCAALVRRKVFESIGYLDPKYFINYDDLDFDLRAKRAGFDVVYVPRAFMWHKVSMTMGPASPATTYYMTRNALALFWSRAPLLLKLVAVSSILVRTLRTMFVWMIKPKYRTDIHRRKLKANAYGLRDFFLRRFGRMGEDVARVCYGS